MAKPLNIELLNLKHRNAAGIQTAKPLKPETQKQRSKKRHRH